MFVIISLSMGVALACILAKIQPVTRLRYPDVPRLMIAIGIGTLLTMLAGCGNSPASVSTQEVKATATTQQITLAQQTATATATPTATQIAPTKSASTPRPVATPTPNGDWRMYHYDNARTGYLANAPDPQKLASLWNKSLDGAVYAEPLVVGGHVIVATEGDTLYSFDTHTGNELWHTNIGQSVPLSLLPCGNIDPSGITGTPIYDPATNLIFAVGEVSGPSHLLVGVDAGTGLVKVRRTIDPAGIDASTHQERAALGLWQGKIYITFGGLYGDCGNYHGWVIAVNTNGQGNMLTYQVPTTREGGIWAPPGPVIDANGNIFVSVGNGEATQGNWDHSDSILRLSPTLALEDGFAPAQWQNENANDVDLGSMGPVLLPSNLVFSAGKSGNVYLLHSDALGGVGGQALQQSVCTAFGGAATANSQIFVPCTDGLRQIKVGPGIALSVGWHTTQVNGSPVIGGHTVYSVSGSTLYALNSDNGSVRATASVGTVSRFATPTLSNGLVFVGTMSGIAALSAS